MRLLRTRDDGDFSLMEFADNKIPPYAILSHVWGSDQDEVTFKDVVEGTVKGRPGYQKLLFCGRRAARDGLTYFWVDTCCIDKSSSAELSESINSMFQWYRRADKCYAYLSDVSAGFSVANDRSTRQTWKSAFRHSKWFTRGWTLQELLAPRSVEFFSRDGLRLDDRQSLAEDIHEITGISIQALRGTPLAHFSMAARFSWTRRRKTKRPEDAAYSLLGIFNVSMSPIYGEGRKRAFVRLQKEIRQSFEGEMLVLPESFTTENDDESESHCSNSTLEDFTAGFQASLSTKERDMLESFDTSSEMLASLKSRYKDEGNFHIFADMLSKVQSFSVAWETCFRFMDTFGLAYPEFISLAWSNVHLVCTVSKHPACLQLRGEN